jgi:hypothetical protein
MIGKGIRWRRKKRGPIIRKRKAVLQEVTAIGFGIEMNCHLIGSKSLDVIDAGLGRVCRIQDDDTE